MARDNRIDSLKGLLIILVMMGHVITSLDNVNFINHGVMGLIYIFHMPLFILLSGYLTKSPDTQSSRSMWKSITPLITTLVIFHILGCVRGYIGSNGTSEVFNGFPFGKNMWVIFPYGELWYILSLIYWRILLFYTPKRLLKRPALYLSIALVVSILCGLSNLRTFLSIQRTMNFYLFFLLGYYYRQGNIHIHWWRNNTLHSIVALVLLPSIFILFPHCGNFMNGADHYTISDIPQKIMILTCSIAVSLLVFNKMRDIKWLRPLGRDSIFYYLYHYMIIILIIMPLVDHFELPRSFPFIMCYTAIIMILLYMMSKIKLLRWLTHPTLHRKD